MCVKLVTNILLTTRSYPNIINLTFVANGLIIKWHTPFGLITGGAGLAVKGLNEAEFQPCHNGIFIRNIGLMDFNPEGFE